MERILILNPGSTSTKIGVYKGDEAEFIESLVHTADELEAFDTIMDQFDFRLACILNCLKKNNIDPSSLTAVVSRGGLLGSIETGAYIVNDDMVWQLRNKPRNQHASNLGAVIAKHIGDELGIPAYIYDGISVEEMEPIYKITGLPEMRRKGHGHTLNTRAAVLKFASENGKSNKDVTVIAAHIGGGITVNIHHKGRIIDSITDEEGPFSPERTGGLPLFDVIDVCYDGKTEKAKFMKRIKGGGGLIAHLGTADCREVEKKIAGGDEKAKLVYEAMALNIAKFISHLAVDVNGNVDAIVITGGVAYSKYITGLISERVKFIAPVVVYPGEDEIRALALGCLRVLRGEERVKVYVKTDDPKA